MPTCCREFLGSDGLGAAGNLLYAAADLWWHDVYGFDIGQATTPSHLGLALSIFVELVGV